MGAKRPPDWREFFAELMAHEVRFVVTGALAVAAHAEPKFSEDLDVFVEPSSANAKKLRRAKEVSQTPASWVAFVRGRVHEPPGWTEEHGLACDFAAGMISV
jgi:hypothetical protein